MKRRAFIQSAVVASTAGLMPRREALAAVFQPAPQLPQEVEAITGDGQPVTLSGRALGDLRASLRGRLLLAGNEGYDEARRIRNPTFDKRPALIVQPTGVADIRMAVDFARDNGGLLLAVKCGGHSFSGQSTCDRGMQIDLSLFRDVRVDPAARRAWVTGGSLLGQVDHETMPLGLVTTLGTVSHTGVGGLVTGGGFGRLGRRFGLSVDNVVAVDVVTADGQLRHASKDDEPDLFWGVRGGGGNFGIVTNFEFQLHPMQRQVIAGPIVYPVSRAREGIQIYADYAHVAPDELNLNCGLGQQLGTANSMFAFFVCYSGPATNLERAIAPIRKLGTPLADNLRAQDYVAVQRSGDVTDPRAQATYLKSGFVPRIPVDLVNAIVDQFRGDPRRGGGVLLENVGGAIARVPADATAVAQRDMHSNLLSTVAWRFGEEDGTEHVQWLRQYWAALEPFTYGFYVNNMPLDTTPAAIQANYRANQDRLVAVKNKYDPRNLFRLNANVKPTI
jgi:hypothetical protein